MLRDAPRRSGALEKAAGAAPDLSEVGGRSISGGGRVRDPLEAVKRRVYLCSLLISAPSLPLLWLTLRNEDPFIHFAFPPMALFCLWCAVALWRNKGVVKKVEFVTFAAVSTFAFAHLVYGVLTTDGLTELRAAAEVTTFPTLIVLYVIAYLIFDTNTGLRASLLLYVGSSALVFVAAVSDGLAGLGETEISWLAQTYAFMGAVIALLYATAFAKSQLSRERALAEAMSHLALTDQLTGVSNRRKLYMDLQHEISAANRHDHPLSVILFDLDHFKLINDAHGHDCGDDVLRQVVRTILPLLRKIDHFGRWGGEEFILVVPKTDLEQAEILAERLRHAVSGIRLEPSDEITASFGIARHLPEDTPESLIKRADEALYRAKASGRNRVFAA